MSDWDPFKPSDLFPRAESSDFFSPVSSHSSGSSSFYGSSEEKSWAFSSSSSERGSFFSSGNESESSFFSTSKSNWAYSSGSESSESGWGWGSSGSLSSGWLDSTKKDGSGWGYSTENTERSGRAFGDMHGFGRGRVIQDLEDLEKSSQSTQENWWQADFLWHTGNVSARLGIMDELNFLRNAEDRDGARGNQWGFETSSHSSESSWAYSSGNGNNERESGGSSWAYSNNNESSWAYSNNNNESSWAYASNSGNGGRDEGESSWAYSGSGSFSSSAQDSSWAYSGSNSGSSSQDSSWAYSFGTSASGSHFENMNREPEQSSWYSGGSEGTPNSGGKLNRW